MAEVGRKGRERERRQNVRKSNFRKLSIIRSTRVNNVYTDLYDLFHQRAGGVVSSTVVAYHAGSLPWFQFPAPQNKQKPFISWTILWKILEMQCCSSLHLARDVRNTSCDIAQTGPIRPQLASGERCGTHSGPLAVLGSQVCAPRAALQHWRT